MSPAARVTALLVIALGVPACNLTFTTDDPFAVSSTPQNPFTLQTPVDGSTGVLTTNTQFSWGALPGATSYQLQIALTAGFAQIIYDQTNILIPSVFVNAGLTHSSTYYWRVYGFSSGPTQLAGGSPYQFTTMPPPFAPPGQFFLQSPTGGPIDRIPSPVFLWTVSAGASAYWFQIDTSPLFTSPAVDLPDVHQNRVTCPITLAANTTYYWRVTATNVFGQTSSTLSDASFFTGP